MMVRWVLPLLLLHEGVSGSGLSSKVESWLDTGEPRFEPVLSFAEEGHYFRRPDGLGQKVSGYVVQFQAAEGQQEVRVRRTVQFLLHKARGGRVL